MRVVRMRCDGQELSPVAHTFIPSACLLWILWSDWLAAHASRPIRFRVAGRVQESVMDNRLLAKGLLPMDGCETSLRGMS